MDLFFSQMNGRGVPLQGGWGVNIVAFLSSRVDLYIRKQDE